MAKYTTNVSDKTKGEVLKSWAIGLLGTLGLHFFKVGRIKHGIIRFLYGLLMWAVSIMLARDPEIVSTDAGVLPVVMMFIILFIPSMVDLVRIALGIFKDNLGAPVREK